LVDGFRDSNVALTRERDDLKRRFERSESEQVKAIAAERDALNGRLMAIQVDQGVITVATKKGLRPSAIPHSEDLSAIPDFGLLRMLIS
jgi:hypothetical protein